MHKRLVRSFDTTYVKTVSTLMTQRFYSEKIKTPTFFIATSFSPRENIPIGVPFESIKRLMKEKDYYTTEFQTFQEFLSFFVCVYCNFFPLYDRRPNI